MSDQPNQERQPQEDRPTPLVGYRDMPQPTGHRHGLVGWIILAVMTIGYLAWTLAVYFFEPGIR